MYAIIEKNRKKIFGARDMTEDTLVHDRKEVEVVVTVHRHAFFAQLTEMITLSNSFINRFTFLILPASNS